MEVEPEGSAARWDKLPLGNLFGPAAAILAVTLFVWQATRPDGWFEAAFGDFARLFWIGIVLWLLASTLAVRARQHWWVITTAPFALYPLAGPALLLWECSQGNCL